MKSITRDECRDAGLAMVVGLLLAQLATTRDGLVPAALVVLILAMAVPAIFRPLALVWFALAHAIGFVSSKILLTAVFFLIVTPMGLLRRLSGKDALRLRAFKASDASVMVTRHQVVSAADLDKPY